MWTWIEMLLGLLELPGLMNEVHTLVRPTESLACMNTTQPMIKAPLGPN